MIIKFIIEFVFSVIIIATMFAMLNHFFGSSKKNKQKKYIKYQNKIIKYIKLNNKINDTLKNGINDDETKKYFTELSKVTQRKLNKLMVKGMTKYKDWDDVNNTFNSIQEDIKKFNELATK